MTLEEAVTAAKAFQRPNDFSTPYKAGEDAEAWRLQAIAGAAAAALFTEFTWAQAQGLIAWCRDILLAAARMPSQEHFIDRYTIFPSDPRVSAARGLGALIVHDAADTEDTEVREQVLRFVGDPQLQVVKAVFDGLLYKVWKIDEVLCWNALSLGLSLCLFPRKFMGRDSKRSNDEARWTEQLIRKHLDNLKKSTIPELPRIPLTEEETVFLWDLAGRVLHAFPFSKLAENSTTKRQLLQLVDDLMSWTIKKNTPHISPPPYEWNQFFLNWAAYLAKSLRLEEARQHVLIPVQKSWSYAPFLTAELLYGYISCHIGYMEPPTAESEKAWREICNWVIDSPELARKARYDFLNSKIADAVSLIVFVQNGESLLKAEWPYIILFSDIIDKWVKGVGYNPSAYGYLITMLNGPGWQFVPEPALTWLSQSVNASSDLQKLWKEYRNGERTAELLQRMWNSVEDQIRGNTTTLQRYARLIEDLVTAGIPLASLLQQKLEKRV
jgi:hypothetical protein